MASTNAFLTLVSTVQTDKIGSTISTGYIPYVSTAGRQTYTSTLSTITVSSLMTNTLAYPSNTSNVATTAYVSSAAGSLLSTANTWAALNTFNGGNTFNGSAQFNNSVSIGSISYDQPLFVMNNLSSRYTNRTTFTLVTGAANATGLSLPNIPLYGTVNPIYHVFATTVYPGPTSTYNNQWFGSAHCMYVQSGYGSPPSSQFAQYNIRIEVDGAGQIFVYTLGGSGTYNAVVMYYRIF